MQSFSFVFTIALGVLPLACAFAPSSTAPHFGTPSLHSPAPEARPSVSLTELRDADSYIARALQRSPAMRAAEARWDAERERVRAARRWPRPSVAYSYFARPLHTRAGPVRQRVAFGWSLPRFGDLSAARRAATGRVWMAEQEWVSAALTIRAAVAAAYWRRWRVHQAMAIVRSQVELLTTASEALRARLAVGATTLAALQQLELRRARLDDQWATLRSDDRHLQEELAAWVVADANGADELSMAETPPAIQRVAEPAAALERSASERPEVGQALARAEVQRAVAASHRARRRPEASLRLEWTEVGPSPLAGVPNDGDDALAFGLGITLPLDVGADRAAERAAGAEVRAAVADSEQAALLTRREVHSTLAAVESTARSALLHETTLLPQALAAYESSLSHLQTSGEVVLALMALRELFEVRLSQVEALAAHAVAWAELERAVGRPVSPEAAGPGEADTEPGVSP